MDVGLSFFKQNFPEMYLLPPARRILHSQLGLLEQASLLYWLAELGTGMFLTRDYLWRLTLSEEQTWTWTVYVIPDDGSRTCFLQAIFEKETTVNNIQNNNYAYCKYDRLCGLVVRVLGCRSGGQGSIPSTTRKKKVVGLERGPLSLVSTTEELLDRKVAAPV
jgi:hypothetical protein